MALQGRVWSNSPTLSMKTLFCGGHLPSKGLRRLTWALISNSGKETDFEGISGLKR